MYTSRIIRSLLPLATLIVLGCADAPEPTAPSALPNFARAATSPVALSAPVFGLGLTPTGGLFAAETFTGVTEIGPDGPSPFAALAGVTGVAAIGQGNLLAVTGGALDPSFVPLEKRLFRIAHGSVREIADLGAYEAAVDPDQVWNTSGPDSNPFNIVQLGGGKALVSDAAGNDILIVDEKGRVDWVAVLTPILASTDHFKTLIGCGTNPALPQCGLPPVIPAQPVATSIAVGPDGAYYAGELTGFPGTPGLARVWRIEPGSRHVLCPSNACQQVLSGLTSIVSLAFGPNGSLYAAELDQDSWLAVEVKSGGGPLMPSGGGRVKECDVQQGTCSVIASGLSLPAAVTVDRQGTVWVAENAAIPGAASVHALP